MSKWCRILPLLVVMLCGPVYASAAAAEPDDADEEDSDEVVALATFNVQADRLEDFGLRISLRTDRERTKTPFWPVAIPVVASIYPNTAASKAGLRPGERILKSDGRSTAVTLFSFNKWRKLQAKKWADVAAGKKQVTWTLEVQSADLKEIRTVKLVVPSPAPHWGSRIWRAPEGRTPATVEETGPLAARAAEILDHGLWVMAGYRTVRVVGGYGRDAAQPFVGYQWTLTAPNRDLHRMFVSQQRGQTEIIFEVRQKDNVLRDYLTSPSGVLKAAVLSRGYRGKGEAIPAAQAAAEFEAEKRFWLENVRRGRRWPLELIPPKPAEADAVNVAMSGPVQSGTSLGSAPAVAAPILAPEFLKLPVATDDQQALLSDAMARMGADVEQWAYTETGHGIEDKRVMVVRVDPSKPEAERCVLLKIDGKTPSSEEVRKWREEGRDSSAALGDLPPIRSLVDFDNVRVVADERAAMVFELPLRSDSREFPADKFQALFRVNKSSRALESFVVKMRASFRVAGVVKSRRPAWRRAFKVLIPR